MNIRLAFFLLVFLLGLLFGSSCSSPFPKELLQFVNGSVGIVTQDIGIQHSQALGLIDVLWNSQNNLILAGNFEKDSTNNTCIPGHPLKVELQSSSYCSFIAKFGYGRMEWRFIHPYYTSAIAVEKNNEILVASENALFKLSTSGQILWEKRLLNVTVLRVLVDQENHIFISGNYQDLGKLGDYVFPEDPVDAKGSQRFFMKLHSDGHVLWSETLTGNFPSPIKHTIAIDNDGNIAVLTEDNDKPFEGEKIIPYYFSNSAIRIAKLDKNKNHLWITSVDDLYKKYIADPIDKIDIRFFRKLFIEIVSTNFRNSYLFFNKAGELFLSLSFFYYSDLIRIFFVKISKEGKPLWANTIKFPKVSTTSPHSLFYKITEDRQNNLYIVGTVDKDVSTDAEYIGTRNTYMMQPVTFGTFPIFPTREFSPFIAKLSPQGEFLWLHIFNVNLHDSTFYQKSPNGFEASLPFVFAIRPDSSKMVFAGIFNGDGTFPTDSSNGAFPTDSSVTRLGERNIFVFTADLEPKVVAPPQ